jgi:hypothetical protein
MIALNLSKAVAGLKSVCYTAPDFGWLA